MNQEKYVKDVMRRLKCSKDRRMEMGRELRTDIQSAMDQGETWENIRQRLGHPAAVASEFNENIADTEKKKYKTGRRIRVVILTTAVLAAAVLGIYLIMPRSFQLEGSGVFSKAEVTSQAEKVVTLLDQGNYSAVRELCANEAMRKALTDELLQKARQSVPAVKGSYSKVTSVYTSGVSQMGKKMAVIQMTVLYGDGTATYTISFDSNMKLTGLYMK